MLRAMARSTIHYLRKRGLTRTAIAGHVGRERYTVAVRWTRRMMLEPLLRGLLAIAEELGGVPWASVFDNMKTVTLGRGPDGQPRWNPAFARFAAELGFHPELCDPHAPQQKGTVENLVKFVKTNFLPGRT